MVDRYTKVVLTVIALCLVWLCVRDPITPAQAGTQSKPRTAAKPAAARRTGETLQVEVVNWWEASLWPVQVSGPVEVTGSVDIDQPVEVTGRVDIDQPVDVTGTVHVDQPVEVEGSLGGYPVKVKVADY